jgi:hypothetical protein
MAVSFVSGLAFRATGRAPHEWIGVGFAVLLGLHLAINWRWCKALFLGRYGARRILNTMTNMVLLVSVILLCVTGIMNSRHIFGFSRYFEGETPRRLHSVSAYWSLIFIGIHTGLHWETIMGAFRRATGGDWQSRSASIGSKLAVLLVVLGGVWASCDRAMGAKLFLGFAFDFWEPGRPLALFYVANFAIAGVYAIAAHYLLWTIKRMNESSRWCGSKRLKKVETV